MLKALYDYGVRRQLALPPGFAGKTMKALFPSLKAMTMSASIWGETSLFRARISAVWPTARIRVMFLQRSALSSFPRSPEAKAHSFWRHSAARQRKNRC